MREIYDSAPEESKELLAFDRKFLRDIERKKKAVSSKIAQFLALPVLLSNAKNEALRECRFYSTNYNLIISDSPVICSLNEDYSMDGEIYFPVGSRLCITNAPREIDRFQQMIFNNAKNIVLANSDECFSNLIYNGSPKIPSNLLEKTAPVGEF